MTLEEEWGKAWNKLEFRRKALAASIEQGRPATDPLRREQTKAHDEALAEYEKIHSQL